MCSCNMNTNKSHCNCHKVVFVSHWRSLPRFTAVKKGHRYKKMSGKDSEEFFSNAVGMPPLNEEESEDEEPLIPEGVTYPLNSKQLLSQQFQRLAKMLDLPTTASASSTLQLLEGKLLEMNYESRNVQVVISNDNGRLLLVSDAGVISAESEYVSVGDAVNEQSHVITSEASEHELESLRSALCKARTEIDALRNELLARDDVLKEVRGELDFVKAELQKLSTEQAVIEVDSLHKQLKTQSARFWSQKCEDL